jgi:hypothetical protein
VLLALAGGRIGLANVSAAHLKVRDIVSVVMVTCVITLSGCCCRGIHKPSIIPEIIACCLDVVVHAVHVKRSSKYAIVLDCPSLLLLSL